MKKILIVIFATLLLCSYAGCGNTDNGVENCAKLSLSAFPCDKGIYYLDHSAYIKFFDYTSGKSVFVCSKPECAHNNENCYAYSDASFIFIQNESLYIIDNENNLVKRNADGSDSSVVMKLCNQYNSSSDSIAYPLGGIAVGNRLYATYSVTVLDSEKGEEKKSTVLTCVDLNNKKEKVLLQAENSQYSIIDYKHGKLYFYEYHSTAEGGDLSDLNQVNCVLYKLNLSDNSLKEIYKDKQINFSPCGYEKETVYFYKDNNPVENLFSLKTDYPTPEKVEHKTVYADDMGNIVYDYLAQQYLLEKGEKTTDLPLDKGVTAAFGYEAKDGLVFTCIDGSVSGKNGEIIEQGYSFYVTKEDFYASKNQYYIIE